MEDRLSRRRLFGLFAVAPVVAFVPPAPVVSVDAYRAAMAIMQSPPNLTPLLAPMVRDEIDRRRARARLLLNAHVIKARG